MNEELTHRELIAFWSNRPDMLRLGYIGTVHATAIQDELGFELTAKTVAQIDSWRAKGRLEKAKRVQAQRRLLLTVTALQLVDHPAFQWRDMLGGGSKVYIRRSSVAAKTAGIIAHDRVLTRDNPTLPTHHS